MCFFSSPVPLDVFFFRALYVCVSLVYDINTTASGRELTELRFYVNRLCDIHTHTYMYEYIYTYARAIAFISSNLSINKLRAALLWPLINLDGTHQKSVYIRSFIS